MTRTNAIDRRRDERPGRQRAPGGIVRQVSVPSIVAALILLLAMPLEAASLRPSRASLNRQNAQARSHDFTFLDNRTQLQQFVDKGWLVPVRPNRNLALDGVSFPYARPAVRLFLQRLSGQYRGACGEQLVVTSLTRPRRYQPRNASPRSVHPTGMALDLRRPRNRRCRAWLEGVLLELEKKRVLEASRERRPPHYHLAVFPRPYERYVKALGRVVAVATHRVSPGDNLWLIARRYGSNVDAIKRLNGLRTNRIRPGQVLRIPD